MIMSAETKVNSFEQYVELLTSPKPKVRKWASERLIDIAGEDAFSALLPLVNDSEDSIAIQVMNSLAEGEFLQAAPIIFERFQLAERNLPAQSVRASWCAQALGKLDYQPALPEFARYIKQHTGDVGLLGIASALGDLTCPQARETLMELLKTLESSKDGGVPYLGDVAIDALIRHRNPEDVTLAIRMHQVWQNDGRKNPRTLATLSRSAGESEIYPQLESAVVRDKADLIWSIKEQETALGIDLSKQLGELVHRGLINALKKPSAPDVITWSRQAAEEILIQRYGGLDAISVSESGYAKAGKPSSRLSDLLSLRILEGLNDPRYKIHHSQLDADTSTRQVLLALTSMLETAARIEYPGIIHRQQSPAELINMITSQRRNLPSELEDKTVSLIRTEDLILKELNDYLASDEISHGKARAARLLGRVGYIPAIATMVNALDTSHQGLREACIKGLLEIGAPVLDYLAENLSSISYGAWAGLAEVMARLPYKRSADLAYKVWQDPAVPQSDGLLMVQERIGCQDSIAYLWEIYQENPNLVGESLELLCDVHDFDFPELDNVREANRLAEEEQNTYQREIWDEIKGNSPKEKYEMILDPDKSKKTAPSQSDKMGRNEPCPCGSGKKFKKCCGKTL